MSKIRRKNKIPGLPPGTLTYTGTRKNEKISIEIFDYSTEHLMEKKNCTVEETFIYKEKNSITWINIEGLSDIDAIEKIGKYYEIHPLTLEDILHMEQLPKIEVFEKYIFITLKMLTFNEVTREVESEQVGIIMGKNFVISFQEGKEGDVFDPLRERIRAGKGRIRNYGADYLNYAIIDIIVDNYFIILEKIGEKVEEYEEKLLLNPEENILKNIYELKREIMFLRKIFIPIREITAQMQYSESTFINERTLIFIRDLYDHSLQVIDMVDTYRETVSGLIELYLSSLSNRMNQVMRILTTISTIFIPLTFIVGVYGMNFDFMPELHFRYGYYMIWGVMVAVGVGMYLYFKKKKWM